MDNWERLAGPTEVQRRASEKKRQVKIYEILDTWSNFVEQMRELCEVCIRIFLLFLMMITFLIRKSSNP